MNLARNRDTNPNIGPIHLMIKPPAQSIRTTCPYCGVGCGVLITAAPGAVPQLRGDPEHPANFGRLCSKGSALGDTIATEGRLLYPEVHGQRVDWECALDRVATGFRRIIAEHGPGAVALYVSGQLLTEDYYVANKLMKGYIGSANIDTNSRLCMASTVAGQKRGLGADVVPGCYDDLELAELVVLVGSNAAWCHPVLFQRLQQARQEHSHRRLVVIDPRRTATAEAADLHLPLRPGSDVVLFNGLLHHLRRCGELDFAFLERHVVGYADAFAAAAASSPSIPAVAAACALREEDVATFYSWFMQTAQTVTAWSQGVNQSSSGTDKVNAILNLHLATGRIGKPGCGPFSLTGQPNAMGGREVGGMANQLAAHLTLEDPAHRALAAEFWGVPTVAAEPGLKAVDLFRAIGTGHIKAVWILATNPVVSLPDVNAVDRALRRCELVVVSDCEDVTDLTPYAHVRLPAAAWGEKDGTVTNSERRISRQRAFLPAPGEARPDWWALSQVAQRLGYVKAFDYHNAYEIFVEHARLSGFHNTGDRLFDISALAALSAADYAMLQPVQWPVTAAAPTGTARLFATGQFARHDRHAAMLPLTPQPPAEPPEPAYPLTLNSGRIRDQWHTMTRTARSAKLTRHLNEPYVELHPEDATQWGVTDGGLARLRSRYGEALARVKVTSGQLPGCAFMPMHWSDTYAKQARVNALVHPAVDPLSGEPDSKFTPVQIEPLQANWYGFAMHRHPTPFADALYAAVSRFDGGWLTELAGLAAPRHWGRWAARQFGHRASDECIEYADRAAGRYRWALLRSGRLFACFFVSTVPELPSRTWLSSLFASEALPDTTRKSLLAGRPASAEQDPGAIVCACFGVGANTLRGAIASQHLRSPEAIGAALKAGTNCGSCIPELKILLAETVQP